MFISHQKQEAAILAQSIPSTAIPDSKPTFSMSESTTYNQRTRSVDDC